MAKKSKFTSQKDKVTLAESKSKAMDHFVSSSIEKMPQANNSNKELIDVNNKKQVKESNSQQEYDSNHIYKHSKTSKKDSKTTREDKMRGVGLNLPDTTVKLLRNLVYRLKQEFDTDGPDRNHIVDLGIRRLIKDLEGEEKSIIMEELLELRQESKERQKPKR